MYTKMFTNNKKSMSSKYRCKYHCMLHIQYYIHIPCIYACFAFYHFNSLNHLYIRVHILKYIHTQMSSNLVVNVNQPALIWDQQIINYSSKVVFRVFLLQRHTFTVSFLKRNCIYFHLFMMQLSLLILL